VKGPVSELRKRWKKKSAVQRRKGLPREKPMRVESSKKGGAVRGLASLSLKRSEKASNPVRETKRALEKEKYCDSEKSY